jgi:hypothetical protein
MSRLEYVPAFLLLLVCSASPQSAVLRSNGTVKINGNAASYSNVVMNGDSIVTDANSSAFLLLPGKMITLGPGSSVLYQNGGVIPRVGAAKITTVACTGLNCATSSTQIGSGSAKNICREDRGDDCHPKKKCVSPKKPKKDKNKDDDCEDD